MFETRILDISGIDIQHIVRIEGDYLEQYAGKYNDKEYIILNAVTNKQLSNLQAFLDSKEQWIEKCSLELDRESILGGSKHRCVILQKREAFERIEDLFKVNQESNEEIDIQIVQKTINELLETEKYLNFAYNRLDYNYGKYTMLLIKKGIDAVYVPYYKQKDYVFLGVSVSPLDTEMLSAIISWIWMNEKEIMLIEMYFALGYSKVLSARNNFSIDLPQKYEDLLKRATKKTVGNVRRESGYFQRDVGEYTIQRYSRDEISKEMVDVYFDMKFQTYKAMYDMEWEEYLDKYYVTNAYTIEIEKKIYAILFSCEQGEIAYLENFSYDADYAKYSLGTIIYWNWIKKLIEDKKKAIYLAGGNYAYKKHFDSINEMCFTGIIQRNDWEKLRHEN